MRSEQLRQIKWRSDADFQCVIEFLKGAFVQPFHEGTGVIDEKIHVAVIGHDFMGNLQEQTDRQDLQYSNR